MLGRTPRGRNSTTAPSRPPNRNSRIEPELAPPRLVVVKLARGSMMKAPSTGPQTVPRPPSSAESTISMLVTMSKTALVFKNVTS
jgi:hypothetical protein